MAIIGIACDVWVGQVSDVGEDGTVEETVLLCVGAFFGVTSSADEDADGTRLRVENSCGVFSKDCESVVIPLRLVCVGV